MSTGKIVQVIGPVIDIEFDPGQLPTIYNALTIAQEGISDGGLPPPTHDVQIQATVVVVVNLCDVQTTELIL